MYIKFGFFLFTLAFATQAISVHSEDEATLTAKAITELTASRDAAKIIESKSHELYEYLGHAGKDGLNGVASRIAELGSTTLTPEEKSSAAERYDSQFLVALKASFFDKVDESLKSFEDSAAATLEVLSASGGDLTASYDSLKHAVHDSFNHELSSESYVYLKDKVKGKKDHITQKTEYYSAGLNEEQIAEISATVRHIQDDAEKFFLDGFEQLDVMFSKYKSAAETIEKIIATHNEH